ncbi:MAG: hypothetical protein EA377_07575 [Phycisphaerales bacterium]|nr:MAG: hypothetical protein EA377_07575 [Phycisphaerales bacterium]
MFATMKTRLAAGAALVAAVGIAAGLTLAPDHHDGESKMTIGTYEPQQVFDNYHRTVEFFEYLEQIQAEAMEAQQAGDQDRLMELEMQFQQRQQELMERFEAAVERTMPSVASDQNVKLIALEIVYSADDIDEKDLTTEILDKLNQNADG